MTAQGRDCFLGGGLGKNSVYYFLPGALGFQCPVLALSLVDPKSRGRRAGAEDRRRRLGKSSQYEKTFACPKSSRGGSC